MHSITTLATQHRKNAAEAIQPKAHKADRNLRLEDLKRFVEGFTLRTPMPTDISGFSISTRDLGGRNRLIRPRSKSHQLKLLRQESTR